MTIYDDIRRAFKDVLENPQFGVHYDQEVVMNPSLDYLFQYPVKGVLEKEDGSGFEIEFDEGNPGGGSIIGVESSSVPVPTLDGMQLVTVVASTTSLRMIFGRVDPKGNIVDQTTVEVDPSDYYIIDPRFDGTAFYPGRVVPEPAPGDSIREQFNDRFADGPVDAEEATDGSEMTETTPEA